VYLWGRRSASRWEPGTTRRQPFDTSASFSARLTVTCTEKSTRSHHSLTSSKPQRGGKSSPGNKGIIPPPGNPQGCMKAAAGQVWIGVATHRTWVGHVLGPVGLVLMPRELRALPERTNEKVRNGIISRRSACIRKVKARWRTNGGTAYRKGSHANRRVDQDTPVAPPRPRAPARPLE
jgi:hypothetical protein